MPQLALRDVMAPEFVGVSESDELQEAVALLRDENTTSAVVLRGSEPVGMLTAETVFDVLAERTSLDSVTVSDVMTDTPAALPQDAPLAEAADLMGRTGDPRVLVTNDDEVRGVLEARDIAPAVAGRTRRTPNARGETEGVGEDADAAVEMADAASDEYANTGTANDYAEQGVCENCGSLATELANVNGRLLCTECRSV